MDSPHLQTAISTQASFTPKPCSHDCISAFVTRGRFIPVRRDVRTPAFDEESRQRALNKRGRFIPVRRDVRTHAFDEEVLLRVANEPSTSTRAIVSTIGTS
ncbi:hypothetical protein PR048_020612 [Dryococelus australis]|uniref:Uncharacterized protein n=1 Tax=Dryococelus australis TaxID=614101 RepID=A0ABQ9H6R4_9NEOP|nr:hypothetical protein PR048_020612 [Dryococelus australis]